MLSSMRFCLYYAKALKRFGLVGGFNGDTVCRRRPYNRVILGVWFTSLQSDHVHLVTPASPDYTVVCELVSTVQTWTVKVGSAQLQMKCELGVRIKI